MSTCRLGTQSVTFLVIGYYNLDIKVLIMCKNFDFFVFITKNRNDSDIFLEMGQKLSALGPYTNRLFTLLSNLI